MVAVMLDEVVARVAMIGKAEGRIHLPDGTVAAESQMSLADVPQTLLASTNPALLNWKVD